MTALGSGARRARWVPPPRPEWVARLNEEGSHLDLCAVVPLTADSLLETAKANTGLDNFGTDEWEEPLRVLCKALDDEAQLTLMGRLMARSDLLHTLEGRLRVEATYREHPEIDDEEIVAPLIIVGQGRSGTSVLQNLLSAAPENGTTRYWEVLFPCPPPEAATYETDSRITKADPLATMWYRVTPEMVAMHEFSGVAPEESIHIHCLSLHSPVWFDLIGQVPSYASHVAQKDPAIAYAYEKRTLKLLQWRNPRRTWIMKAPYTLSHMPSVLKVYPDAGFIWPHRDPVKAMASATNFIGLLHYLRSDDAFQGDSLAQFTNADMASFMMTQPIRWLESGELPRQSLCNVQYGDFVADPMAVVAHIYDHFGLELTDESAATMRRYMEENPRTGRPAHEYDLGSTEEILLERAAFREYQEYFGVPDEIR